MDSKSLKEVRDLKKLGTYPTKVGCWNCDHIYEISIAKGTMAPKYLMDHKLKCKNCGCDTLKMFSEYRIDKKIMKDVILHHRIEHPPEDEEKKKKAPDHIK